MNNNKIYTKKVIEHFKNPHNLGKLENPDGIGKVGNLICGDVMHIYIQVEKNKKGKEIIKNIKFETFGCVAALSTSSVVTDLAKGKTLDQALQINKDDIVKILGGLPAIKLHCSVLAIDALSEAIYDYLAKNKRKIAGELQKRHKKIKKDLEVIEKRYEELLKKK